MESRIAAAGFGVPGESIRLSKTAVRRKSWKLSCCGPTCCGAALLVCESFSHPCCFSSSLCGVSFKSSKRLPHPFRFSSDLRGGEPAAVQACRQSYRSLATGRSILELKLSGAQCFRGSLLKTWRENDHPEAS